MELFASVSAPLKKALEDAQKAGVPIAEHKEQKEWDGEEIFRRDGVPDRPRKIAADEQLNPRDDARERLRYLRFGGGGLSLVLHAVFGCARGELTCSRLALPEPP